MSDKVAIVTVVYNDPREQFVSFLGSLKKMRGKNHSLILVNNGRKNRWLREEAKKYKIKLIERDSNIGFCAGCNLGIKKALADGANYIMLLNGDTTVGPDLLSELRKYLEKNPSVGIVSPIILSARNKVMIFYGGGTINHFFGFVRHKFMNYQYRNGLIKSGVTDFASGCCMLIKRSVFDKIGLLDEEYFMYFDDPDFCLRAKAANFKVHILAKPLVFHINSGNELDENAAYYYGRNPFIMIRKNFPWYYKPSAYLGQFVIRLPRNLFRLNDLKSGTKYLKGILDGILRK